MKKFSQLMLIGTVLAAFVGLEVLAAKLGGTILYWVGIALFIACTRRLRDARNAITPRPKVGDEGQETQPLKTDVT
jgi:uncharacterized membrane protein YgaE (UPF0421/DUF939 family)